MKLNNLVKEIIQNNIITKQTGITDILSKKYNVSITQSNISRILKQINAVKVMTKDKKVIYEIQDKLGDPSSWMKAFVKKVENNGMLILINTYPGSASIVSQVIDEANLKNIMGTLAGENTVLVIPKDPSKIKEIEEQILKDLVKINNK